MNKIRLCVVETRESYYVADLRDVEKALSEGYEIVACCALGNGSKIVYTLVKR